MAAPVILRSAGRLIGSLAILLVFCAVAFVLFALFAFLASMAGAP